MAYSTIKKKKCKNELCDKYPKIGYNGFCGVKCMPEEMQEDQKYKRSSVIDRNKAKINDLSRKVKSYASEKNALKSPRISLKLLLLKADAVFSHFIRDRDTFFYNSLEDLDILEKWHCNISFEQILKEGVLTCYCCGRKGFKNERVDKEDPKSDFLFNCLHFVSRSVYSLRFDDIHNARTGCCYCNENMHSQPKGKAYQQFRQKLVIEFGEEKVQWMEAQKYVVNKLTHADLEMIIEKYKK